DPGCELVVLGLVLEALGRHEILVSEDDRLPPRLVREGDRDRAALAGLVLAPREPESRFREGPVRLVRDREDVTRRSDPLEEAETPLLHESAAALPVAYE